jgi:hypothetical protein
MDGFNREQGTVQGLATLEGYITCQDLDKHGLNEGQYTW